MAPLVESMEPKRVRTYEETLIDAQEEARDLSWLHYLGTYEPNTTGFNRRSLYDPLTH